MRRTITCCAVASLTLLLAGCGWEYTATSATREDRPKKIACFTITAEKEKFLADDIQIPLGVYCRVPDPQQPTTPTGTTTTTEGTR